MPEFSRRVALAAVPAGGRTETLVADAGERRALAERFGILAIDSLEATLRLRPEADGGVRVAGVLAAAVVQSCVVSGAPVAQAMSDPIDWRLLPGGVAAADGPDDPDEIETDGVADLGEAVAEQLALALDPLPRAADAVLPALDEGGPTGPFAALARRRPGG